LEKPGQEIKDLLPTGLGKIHLVRGVSVQEKGMKEQRGKPVNEKER
jgi:hypothetical protein